MRNVYRSLLCLYPKDYRREYGAEMLSVILESQQSLADKSMAELLYFSARETAGLLCGAGREH
jgi:hypothetical protein